jgi:hypothetical protein
MTVLATVTLFAVWRLPPIPTNAAGVLRSALLAERVTLSSDDAFTRKAPPARAERPAVVASERAWLAVIVVFSIDTADPANVAMAPPVA